MFIYMPADTNKNKRGQNASGEHYIKQQTHKADPSAKIITYAQSSQPAPQSNCKAGAQGQQQAKPQQTDQATRKKQFATNSCDGTNITRASKQSQQARQEARRCSTLCLF